MYIWVVCDISYESCPIWMGHVPYEWVMSHMNESCPIWMRHVPFWGVQTKWNWQARRESTYSGTMSKGGGFRVMSQIHLSHVLYIRVMSHMNESWGFRVMSQIHLSHVLYIRVMSHMNESCPIDMRHVPYVWVIAHIYLSRVLYIRVMSNMKESSHMNELCPNLTQRNWQARRRSLHSATISKGGRIWAIPPRMR